MPPEKSLEPAQEGAGRQGNWELHQKPRPYHRPLRIVSGVLWHLGAWIGLGAFIYCATQYFLTQDKIWLQWLLLSLVGHIVCRVGRYSNGLHTSCPLCHGTPLLEKSCRKHRFANKFLFLSHRTSTVLSILLRGTWNCMYCGTPFRLRKK